MLVPGPGVNRQKCQKNKREVAFHFFGFSFLIIILILLLICAQKADEIKIKITSKIKRGTQKCEMRPKPETAPGKA